MENEEIKHFSHEEHPLILSELQKIKNDDGSEKVLICYGCQQQILEPKAYCCFVCDFFLHKRCAELPQQITHPMHSQHPLDLLREPTYSSKTCTCNACSQQGWKFFTYHCSLCSFDLDVCCAMLDTRFKHENHDHPLIQLRSAAFICNACCEIGEDLSYLCTTCRFWIHKRCASMPTKVDYKDHNHSLLLAPFLPYEHRNFNQECSVCHKKVHPSRWVYYCGACRYFIHFGCILISQYAQQQSSGDVNDSTSDEKLVPKDRDQYCNKQNLIKLPLPHPPQELFAHLLHKRDESDSITTSSGETKIKEIILINAHKHPLILSTYKVQEAKSEVVIRKESDVELVCDRCIEPIRSSDLHYSCGECCYFLHLTCYEFPRKLQTPKHIQHQLSLMGVKYRVGCFTCSACKMRSNSHLYRCEPCGLDICIKCTSVTMIPTVKHNAHEHLLSQVETSNPFVCNACGFRRGSFGFGCEDCYFFLCYECALLPSSTRQRWDKHPLILVYPPYFEHPEEFYCVFCEKEMNPNRWMYHCRECDYSLHPWCIPEIRLLRNLKFGRSLWVDNHSHPLTHVHEAKEDSFCEGCNKSLDWKHAFECVECRFYLCPNCAFKREYLSTR